MEVSSESKVYYAMLLTVLAIVLVPIWIVDYPGLTDYPNHLVRCYILAHYHESPLWMQRYSVDLTPIPNLAVDLVVIPLLRFFPLLVCGKLFLSMAAILYVFGCSAVGKAITGKYSWISLACGLTFYNAELQWGLINFMFGVGIFLCAFAFWLRVRNNMTAISFLVCALLAIAAFIAHLSSFVLLGIACFIVAVDEFRTHRRPMKSFVQLVWLGCPVVIMGAYLHGSGRVGEVTWSFSLTNKLIKLLSPIKSYDERLMGVVAVTLLICLAVILTKSTFHRVVLVAVAFFALYMITPDVFLTTQKVSQRYIIPFFLMLLLSLETKWGRAQKIALGVALMAMTINIGEVTKTWIAMNRQSKQVIAMGDLLPEGSSVFVLQPLAPAFIKLQEHSVLSEMRFVHLTQYWTVSRKADVSTLFAQPGQQPLVFRDMSCHGVVIPQPDWLTCARKFNFIWTFGLSPAYKDAISSFATPAATWDLVTLWQVEPLVTPVTTASESAPGATSVVSASSRRGRN